MMISCNVETGARKDLRSVQNNVIISTKFFVLQIFKYLPFGTFGKEFLPQLLDLRLKPIKFLDYQPWMCEKSKKLSKSCIEKSCNIFRKVGKSNRGL